MHQHSYYKGTSRTIGKKRVWKIFWRDYSQKCSQTGKGNSQLSPRSTESPIQCKPKEKHDKKHTNQILNNLTQRKNIKSSKGKAAREKQQVTKGKSHTLNNWSFSRNSAGQKGMAGSI